MNKQKLIIILVLLAGLTLFAYIQSLGYETAGTDDKNNMEEVTDRIYSYLNEVDEEGLAEVMEKAAPGITKARELGLTRTYDTEWELGDTNDTLRIEEVWIRKSHHSFLFYSVDLADDTERIHDFPKLTSRIEFDDHDLEYYNEVYSDNEFTGFNHVYKDGRYYGVAMFYLPYFSPDIEIVELEEIKLTPTTVHSGGNIHQIESITLDVDYQYDDIPYNEINGSSVMDIGGLSVKVDSIRAHPESFDLQFKFMEHPDLMLDSLWGYLTGAGDSNSSVGMKKDNYTYLISYDTYSEPVNDLTFTLDWVRLKSNESLEVTLPTNKELFESVKDAEIYSGEYGTILIKQVSYNQDKHYTIDFRFIPNEDAPYHYDLSHVSIDYGDTQWSENEEFERANILSFSSDNEKLDPQYLYMGSGSSEHSFELLLDQRKVEELDEITLSFENIGINVDLNDSFTIPQDIFNY
ncbi:hypothetical protein BTR22_09435 [Alkalihalophilus pseudofirmus]|uniref:hypothetical protein n=1 Tax=Alkalihalophilus pseudofirmus TaxID=79885 RepID=UPI000952AF71|nr:hypothetical protein BTR22_09435 [Alkalihalophilus pseudofirmus]